mmetsp:Transcript_748/g.2434  ORF Transcript_748/g.2434 Transcript_748/m.2434 type:complete len:332 (-) Transcript_748:88-1083(-)
MAASIYGDELLVYNAPWPVYSLGWSYRPDSFFRMAIGSFTNEYDNRIRIVSMNSNVNAFETVCELPHLFPPTKVGFSPGATSERGDLLASTGDCLRLWHIEDGRLKNTDELTGQRRQDEFCAPLTSFDWNEEDPSLLGTSSIDTTCTVWNVETKQVKAQLIAHDREVYDIAFAKKNIFASVGADGSVRMFDLRNLEYSTVLFESKDNVPLVRVEWNKQDPNYLATVMMESSKMIILDIRQFQNPVFELQEYGEDANKFINSFAWAPHSRTHISSAGESGRALIWDLSDVQHNPKPILSYNARRPIDNIKWSSAFNDWIAFASGTTVQVLRV